MENDGSPSSYKERQGKTRQGNKAIGVGKGMDITENSVMHYLNCRLKHYFPALMGKTISFTDFKKKLLFQKKKKNLAWFYVS